MNIAQIVISIVVAYLIGSIPVAYLIGKMHDVDVFKIGSGNMGASNISRSVSKPWGGITWFLDSSKGVIAILIVRQIMPADQQALATMIGAVVVIIGHVWSIAVRILIGEFRGGKGAATTIGTWFLFMPLPIIVLILALWILILYVTKFISLTVLTTQTLMSLIIIGMVATHRLELVYLSYLVVTIVIFYRHQKNIQALLAGRERRISDPKPAG